MKMPGRLGTLQARDLMSTDVLVLAESMTLLDASRLLKQHRHSGAPVIDARGKLVGTFSVRDLTGVKKKPPADSLAALNRPASVDSGIITAEALQHIQDNALAWEKVADRMTPNAPNVTENASLIDVARLMCDFHTHRIPVTSVRGELRGIITTMDILAALVHTADELAEDTTLP